MDCGEYLEAVERSQRMVLGSRDRSARLIQRVDKRGRVPAARFAYSGPQLRSDREYDDAQISAAAAIGSARQGKEDNFNSFLGI